jgi:hypothetical protein
MRNALEKRVSAALPTEYCNEVASLSYSPPEATYTPDWMSPNARRSLRRKGLWRPEDRRKMRMIVEQHPGIRIIMVRMPDLP